LLAVKIAMQPDEQCDQNLRRAEELGMAAQHMKGIANSNGGSWCLTDELRATAPSSSHCQ
jgi:hypothetical protein